MYNLILNENMKIYRRPRTWVMFGSIVSLVLIMSFILKLYGTEPITGWKAADSLFSLTQLAIIFCIVIAGDTVTSEFSSGTIKMLLTQSQTRGRVLFSKYISSIIFTLFMLVTCLVVSVLVNGVLYGFGGMNTPSPHGGVFHVLMMKYVTVLISAVMYVTVAFLISSLSRSNVLSTLLSILFFMLGPSLTATLKGFEWSKYILFANTDLMQYIVGKPMFQGMTLGLSITVLIVYFIGMNVLTWSVFSKRDVTA
ncbi:ABC transporter permease [Fictibacillus barbaricus]|uniref:ABC transporter permease n=1 Tax=Fictibacillus barbaricus TaxID=182136 RepID=A0ABS2Z7T0_9BACL|nr:ABC transporter permease [Fictibacillus barbaricus]MBN3544120.1 ABC transporter permease [Fictibacillus barbaricus]GGB69110.1 hypothetical protein GCM10007199_39120 [Fictibacillus barbaricus]